MNLKQKIDEKVYHSSKTLLVANLASGVIKNELLRRRRKLRRIFTSKAKNKVNYAAWAVPIHTTPSPEQQARNQKFAQEKSKLSRQDPDYLKKRRALKRKIFQ